MVTSGIAEMAAFIGWLCGLICGLITGLLYALAIRGPQAQNSNKKGD